jgi:hypothetical protein
MPKIKVDKTKFNKVLESIRKSSEGAALVYLKLIQKEFAGEVSSLGTSMQNVISDPNAFSYLPNRDIILSGELKKSQKVTYKRLQAAVQWPVQNEGYRYSRAVYHGFHPWGNPNSYIPGRKWPELALKRKPNLRLVLKVEDGSKGIIAYIAPVLDRY